MYRSPQKQLCAECGPHVVSRTGWFVVLLEKAGGKRDRELTHVGEKKVVFRLRSDCSVHC